MSASACPGRLLASCSWHHPAVSSAGQVALPATSVYPFRGWSPYAAADCIAVSIPEAPPGGFLEDRLEQQWAGASVPDQPFTLIATISRQLSGSSMPGFAGGAAAVDSPSKYRCARSTGMRRPPLPRLPAPSLVCAVLALLRTRTCRQGCHGKCSTRPHLQAAGVSSCAESSPCCCGTA